MIQVERNHARFQSLNALERQASFSQGSIHRDKVMAAQTEIQRRRLAGFYRCHECRGTGWIMDQFENSDICRECDGTGSAK